MLSKKLKKSTQAYRQNRVFSESFKRQKVKEIEAKQLRVSQICDLYEVSRTSVYRWLKKYGQNTEKNVKIVVEMESESYKTKQLLERVAELERVVGLKQLDIDYLNHLLELESQEVGYDIKKKHAPIQSNHLSKKSTPIAT